MTDVKLIKFDAAKAALSAAVRTDEVISIRDKARAIQAAAKIANDRQLEADAFELRTRAELRLGALMEQQKETVGLAKPPVAAGPGRGKKGEKRRVFKKPDVSKTKPTLLEAGIDKNLANRARKLQAMEKKNPGSVDRAIVKAREEIVIEKERPRAIKKETPNEDRERARGGDWGWAEAMIRTGVLSISRSVKILDEFEHNEKRCEKMKSLIDRGREELNKIERWIDGRKTTAERPKLKAIQGGQS